MSYYKISGEKSETARVIIIDESDWSIESNTVVSGSGAYSIDTVASGTKLVLARASDGWLEGYGSVEAAFVYEAEPVAGPTRGVWGGGWNDSSAVNTMDYVTIATTGNAAGFGNLSLVRYYVQATSNGTNDRGIWAGGSPDPYSTDVIDYHAISTTGNAADFGNLVISLYATGTTSNDTNERAVFGGGQNYEDDPGDQGIIDDTAYRTINSLGNAANFGTLTYSRYDSKACSNGTNERAVFGGSGISPAMDYLTINTLSASASFGDLSELCIVDIAFDHTRGTAAATSNGTNERGVFGGGYVYCDMIDYITINSTGNATQFGKLTATPFGANYGRGDISATSNGVSERGLFGGGEYYTSPYVLDIIDYVTINSIGDATDFGNLTASRGRSGACSG